ncbi:hypothetical protein RRG08_042388 [Elysia crispata]|uniref:Uncharacterized protein n=1 Tax=Elysia crispata TaxID=231223 RepID=A0AAE0ZC67_9GAST|nr:hypothetical protein RRG08_042388 [Elysia crispata]
MRLMGSLHIRLDKPPSNVGSLCLTQTDGGRGLK